MHLFDIQTFHLHTSAGRKFSLRYELQTECAEPFFFVFQLLLTALLHSAICRGKRTLILNCGYATGCSDMSCGMHNFNKISLTLFTLVI